MNRRPLILILVQGLFLVLFLLLSNLVAAQLDIKNYYPIPKAIKMESNEVKDIPSYFDVSECVSGDCNNGEGVWLRMYADKEQTGSSSDGFAFTTVYYFIYKGTFSNNGTALKGKQISGGMRFTKDDNSKKVEPAKKIDLGQLAQEMAAVDFEGIYEGYTIKDKTYYRRKEGFVSTVSWRKNRYHIKSEYVWYTEGKERMAEVIYEVSDKISYQKIQGIRNLDQEFLIGKVDYTDGSEYTGFLYNGKRQGSGVFKDGINPAQEGIWIDNVFSYKMDITIPAFTYDPNVKEDFNPATLLDWIGRTK
uniref:hypothetical protein n=1 Tax=Gelidibacter sp. TaxID=2018083 RepID=UPI0040491CE1